MRSSLLGRTRAGHRHELLQSMDEVPGVTLIDVDLPRDPAPPPRSRTVQSFLHPNLIRSYSPPEHALRVALIPEGRLLGSGGVLTSTGRLVQESLWDEDHYRRDFQAPRAFRKPARLEGVCASLVSLWCDNYFHWIFNSLPRLAVLRASGVDFDYLIVPERMKPFQRQTLALLGISAEQLVPFKNQHVQAEVLVWAAPLAPINEPSTFLLDWIRESLCPFEETPRRLLYVSRRGGTRTVVNEREVYNALRPLGFELVLPERLPFAEQVQLFAQARVAVGPHGSNFVNGVFSRHMSVCEFFQPEHVNWGVYSVLCAAGHDHWNILCEPVRGRGPSRFDNMKVPVDDVLETVELISSQDAGGR